MATREQAYQHARRKFSEHVATYNDYGELAVLNWQKPGRRDYSIRYIFDKVGNTLSIAGDLGAAVVYPTAKATLESLAESFDWIDYFAEKIRASSDFYSYDDKKVYRELREHRLADPEDMLSDEDEEMLTAIAESWDRAKGPNLTEEMYNWLTSHDPDAWEWIGQCGQEYHLRVFLWLFGLRFAWKQIQARETMGKS